MLSPCKRRQGIFQRRGRHQVNTWCPRRPQPLADNARLVDGRGQAGVCRVQGTGRVSRVRARGPGCSRPPALGPARRRENAGACAGRWPRPRSLLHTQVDGKEEVDELEDERPVLSVRLSDFLHRCRICVRGASPMGTSEASCSPGEGVLGGSVSDQRGDATARAPTSEGCARPLLYTSSRARNGTCVGSQLAR